MCAFEITSHRSDGEGARARMEIEKWFLLYGIHVGGDDLSIDQTIKHSIPVFTNATDAFFATVNNAAMIA
jgi:hypothetical protein